MPKAAKQFDLEESFVDILGEHKLRYQSRIFNLGDKLYLPDFVFDRLIVEIDQYVTDSKLSLIKEFRKLYLGHKIALLGSSNKRCLAIMQEFDEVYDVNNMDLLLFEIRKHLKIPEVK